jgi:cell division protein FtsW
LRAEIGRRNRILLMVTFVLLVVGTLAVYSASSFISMRQSSDAGSFHYLLGHMQRVGIGLVAGAVAYLLPQRTWRSLSPWLFLAALLLLASTVVPGNPFSPRINGASRWVVAGPLRIMPSELVRLSYVMLVAALVSQGQVSPRCPWGFVFIALLGFVPATLMIFQPDFAGAAYLTAVMIALMFLAEARLSHLILLLLFLLSLATVGILSSSYRKHRIFGYRHPTEHVREENFQPYQACIALGSGGLQGRGLGQGRQQRGFLPEAFSDFILAVIGEETGFVGTTLLLSLMLVLCLCGWTIAADADDVFSQIAAGGLTVSIAMGAVIHTGVVTRLLPATGMPLPLISWGGTNIVVTLASVGLLARMGKGGR